MALVFHPPQQTIDLTMEKLKSDGIVHPDATFNASAPDGLRREVTYRDLDFTQRLGWTSAEEDVVDSALNFLKSQGIIESSANYDKRAFENLRQEVKTHFKGSWTSFSPTMERLVYMLTSVRKPQRLAELGSFWGYTLAWFAGPCIGSAQVYRAEKIYGIDIDAEMTEQARENFAKLPNSKSVKLIAEDAQTVLDHLPTPIDFLYIEAKTEGIEEGLYLKLLKQAYLKLSKDSWVIAHDCLDWMFQNEIQEYLAWVRKRQFFSESICFDIDDCGLELSIR